MQNYGFARVAAASPELRVADCVFNADQIIEAINTASTQEVEYLVLPELCITGYSCADLFLQPRLLESAMQALLRITAATAEHRMIVIAGLPVSIKSRLFNCAAVLQQGRILGIVVKTCIPGYSEFYEPRWFAGAEEPGGDRAADRRIGGAGGQ